eukprot:CAMPEP_0205875114 /NCGR_PEP_ID=MMETSP1083-20121108/13084_1 /ASSEMBLY_ACC=CAM_ASM_000430 /TAXON_ID=97485 /ORGANISM="Prymnesium parvum, Strain Texoma1" /LENGTH=239 /DNA_ID=CAMNT_0053237771 /DNA_START=545 /DNA_END=1265 /DNA_ORIENTATION=+
MSVKKAEVLVRNKYAAPMYITVRAHDVMVDLNSLQLQYGKPRGSPCVVCASHPRQSRDSACLRSRPLSSMSAGAGGLSAAVHRACEPRVLNQSAERAAQGRRRMLVVPLEDEEGVLLLRDFKSHLIILEVEFCACLPAWLDLQSELSVVHLLSLGRAIVKAPPVSTPPASTASAGSPGYCLRRRLCPAAVPPPPYRHAGDAAHAHAAHASKPAATPEHLGEQLVRVDPAHATAMEPTKP